MFVRLAQPATRVRRRVITGLALVAYVASVTGYPLPAPSGVQDTSVAFPCQGHACGCLSADQCWNSCCCYSPAERLAWVRAHGATLPAETLAALESAAADSQVASHGSCCQQSAPAAKSCCEADGDEDCHQNTVQGDDHQGDTEQVAAQPRGSRFDWINGIQAQKCQGLTTLWIVSGANLPLEIRTLWEFDWVLAGQVSIADACFQSLAADLDVPPPRV